MFGLSWSSIITVFFTCVLKPGFAGIPAAVFGFGYNFWQTLIICGSGGIVGSVFFTFLIGGIQKAISKLLDKYYPNRNLNKKKFTRQNRLIIKAKKNFGTFGIAMISPPLLSIPLGVFLALRFFGNRAKIILWMSVSVIIWTVILYFVYNAFQDSLKSFFSHA